MQIDIVQLVASMYFYSQIIFVIEENLRIVKI